jgi:hypothetical protein
VLGVSYYTVRAYLAVIFSSVFVKVAKIRTYRRKTGARGSVVD